MIEITVGRETRPLARVRLSETAYDHAVILGLINAVNVKQDAYDKTRSIRVLDAADPLLDTLLMFLDGDRGQNKTSL